MKYKIILPNEIKDLKIYGSLNGYEYEAINDDMAIQVARTVQISIHQQMNYLYGLSFDNIGFDLGSCLYRIDKSLLYSLSDTYSVNNDIYVMLLILL